MNKLNYIALILIALILTSCTSFKGNTGKIKKLVGTILSDDPDNFALIKLPGDDDQIIVKQGQTIGKFNAIVKKIEKDLLVIEENKKILTLELDE